MKFGIHNPSWRFGTDPAGIFDAVKAKALWAEDYGFTWFSVMDHVIQIAMAGPPEEPFMEGWTILTALAAVTKRIRLATLVSSVSTRSAAAASPSASAPAGSRRNTSNMAGRFPPSPRRASRRWRKPCG